MKIRTQHVSNSSTSSFVGWGWQFSQVKVKDIGKLKDAMVAYREECLRDTLRNMDKIEKKVGVVPEFTQKYCKVKTFDEWRAHETAVCNSDINEIREQDEEDFDVITEDIAEKLGIVYQHGYDDYDLESGFIDQPDYEESPKQMCDKIKEKLQSAGCEVEGNPSYYEEAIESH